MEELLLRLQVAVAAVVVAVVVVVVATAVVVAVDLQSLRAVGGVAVTRKNQRGPRLHPQAPTRKTTTTVMARMGRRMEMPP